MTNAELAPAPKRVKDLVRLIPKDRIEILEISDESKILGEIYIKDSVVGKIFLLTLPVVKKKLNSIF
ncbi:MAG: hypothetical protein ACPGTO_05135 [Polaribacter sp.]